MKRLLTLMSLLALAFAAQAQIQVIVTGTVSNSSTGQPQANLPVVIQEMTGGMMGYIDTVLTDNMGVYADTIFPRNSMGGGFIATITDCNGNTQRGIGQWSPNQTTMTINLDYCRASAPCSANFGYQASGLTVSFAGRASGGQGPYRYRWDYGDGNTGTGLATTHTYGTAGSYTVCLIIDDAAGCSDTTCQTVRVTAPAPCNARFSHVAQGLTVNFQNLSQPAPNPLFPSTYSWDFGDNNTSNAQNPTHTYAQAGTYTVCLIYSTRTANGSCTDTACYSIRVTAGNPGRCAARFSHTSTGLTAAFRDLSTPQVGPNMASWSWDFGDGNTSNRQNPAHTYSRAGNYTVCLIYTVTSAGGVCADTSCTNIQVNPGQGPNCRADFNFRVRRNGVVQFVDDSRPNSGPNSASSWSWDFGDGNTSTARNPRHRYAQGGVYTVCLIFTWQPNPNAPSCTDTVCRRVRVPVNTPPPCVARFTSRPTASGAIGFVAMRPNGPQNNTYSWDFGDGNTGTGRTTTHTYAQSGTYTVCLIVTCGAGGADTTCRSITVGNIQRQSISGVVRTNPQQGADSAVVYLITLDTQAGTLTAVDSTYTTPNGAYSFNNIGAGDYRVKAALQPSHPLYRSRIPTYHFNALHWSFANVITVNNGPAVANITLIAGRNPGGPGFIGGLISQGANKTGDPLANVSLILTDEDDIPFTHTRTDQDGEYSFSNLPYGTYRVYIEVIGKDYLYQTVSITPGSTSVTNVNFEVNSEYITTSLEDIIIDGGFSIAPNPASNEVKVNFELKEASSYDLRVFNMMGQRVLSQHGPQTAGQQQTKLDISSLPNGMYTVQLTAGKQQLSRKLIVVK